MALIDEIPAGAEIALDTDCLIYYVEEHDRYLPVVEPVVERVVQGTFRAHVSVVSLLVVLVLPLRNGQQDVADTYRETLGDPSVVSLHPVTQAQAERAAEIRAEYRLETSDSLIAAMALQANCSHFITNNASDFRRVPGLNVLAIDNFV